MVKHGPYLALFHYFLKLAVLAHFLFPTTFRISLLHSTKFQSDLDKNYVNLPMNLGRPYIVRVHPSIFKFSFHVLRWYFIVLCIWIICLTFGCIILRKQHVIFPKMSPSSKFMLVYGKILVCWYPLALWRRLLI